MRHSRVRQQAPVARLVGRAGQSARAARGRAARRSRGARATTPGERAGGRDPGPAVGAAGEVGVERRRRAGPASSPSSRAEMASRNSAAAHGDNSRSAPAGPSSRAAVDGRTRTGGAAEVTLPTLAPVDDVTELAPSPHSDGDRGGAVGVRAARPGRDVAAPGRRPSPAATWPRTSPRTPTCGPCGPCPPTGATPAARTWLLSIARRAAVDAVRATGRRRRLARLLAARAEPATVARLADGVADRAGAAPCLDTDRRTAFVLTQLLGFDYAGRGRGVRAARWAPSARGWPGAREQLVAEMGPTCPTRSGRDPGRPGLPPADRAPSSPPRDLPVVDCLDELRAALADPAWPCSRRRPGAGKTTVVPLALLGRAVARRRGASSCSSPAGWPPGPRPGAWRRCCGEQVGEHRRLPHPRRPARSGRATRIEVVTEGILTRRLQRDPALDGVGLVIFDEFHERSLQADLGLALALDARRHLRPDLRLLAMSATLDGDRVAGAARRRRRAGAGRHQREPGPPRRLRWAPRRPRDHVEPAVVAAVRQVAAAPSAEGDVLVFLPGAGEIRAGRRRRWRDALGRRRRSTSTCCTGRCPPASRTRPSRPGLPGRRKVVLATDIAETSLTVEGVPIVVDAGLARGPRFDAAHRPDPAGDRCRARGRRPTSARAGPGAPGRAWPSACGPRSSTRPRRPFAEPEIRQVDLAGLALELAVWGTDAADAAVPRPAAGPGAGRGPRRCCVELGALDGDARADRRGPGDGRPAAAPPPGPHGAGGRRARARRGSACLLAALLEDRDVLRGRPDDLPGRRRPAAGAARRPAATPPAGRRPGAAPGPRPGPRPGPAGSGSPPATGGDAAPRPGRCSPSPTPTASPRPGAAGRFRAAGRDRGRGWPPTTRWPASRSSSWPSSTGAARDGRIRLAAAARRRTSSTTSPATRSVEHARAGVGPPTATTCVARVERDASARLRPGVARAAARRRARRPRTALVDRVRAHGARRCCRGPRRAALAAGPGRRSCARRGRRAVARRVRRRAAAARSTTGWRRCWPAPPAGPTSTASTSPASCAAWCPTEVAADLDRLAPPRAGRADRAGGPGRLRDGDAGDPPVLAVRVQDLFGTTEHPTVADGRVPVVAAPAVAGRPAGPGHQPTCPGSGPGRGTRSARRWPAATRSTTGPNTPGGRDGQSRVNVTFMWTRNAVTAPSVTTDLLLLDVRALDAVHRLGGLGDADLGGLGEAGG